MIVVRTANARAAARAVALFFVAALAATPGCGDAAQKKKSSKAAEKAADKAPSAAATPAGRTIAPIAFAERNGKDVYNASGVVCVGDSRFLFCDNNSGDALFELDLTAEGKQKGPIARRPLAGLAPGAVDDLEALTIADVDGKQILFATTSLSAKKGKKDAAGAAVPGGLVRVRVGADGVLAAESMPGFREWFLKSVPELAGAAGKDPDAGGLNVEGLAWDADRGALLVGLRTPLAAGGKPSIVPVRVKDLAGPWTTANLEVLPAVHLAIASSGGALGIRGIEAAGAPGKFLVLVGNATSGSDAPFALYDWDGNAEGVVARRDLAFAGKMKAESVAHGVVAGKGALVFVDDGGGFQVLWD